MSSPTLIAGFLVLALAPSGAAPEAGKAASAALRNAGCRDCHNSEGVASETRLVFPEPGASRRDLDEAARGLLELVDRGAPERSRLLRKPTKRIMHEGGQKIAPGSPEERALVTWVAALAADPRPENAAAVLAPEVQAGGSAAERGGFRRLTASQYDNTVRDLLGDLTRPGRQFPPEDFVDGFKNQYQAQSPSAALAEAWNLGAARMAAAAARSIRRGDPRHLLPCPARHATPVCVDHFVQAFGPRAFRRPLSAPELARFRALAQQERDPVEGVRLAIETMLQSPSFLYLADTTDAGSHGYARASRLSYFLWNTMPDPDLFAAAARGDLDRPEGVARVATRMLEDQRARDGVGEFVAQWMRTDRVRTAFKDRRLYPQFTPEIAGAMADETTRFVEHLVWDDRDFRELVTADYTFANGDLATHYGLAPPEGGGFARVAYPEAVDRAGLLGHGSFLAGNGKPGDTSPTARGLFVREQLLCQHVPPPPAGVNMNLPPLSEDRPLTNRERLAAHTHEETCARCHHLIDAIGFGLEKLDTVGRWQETVKVPRPRKRDGEAEDKRPPTELKLDVRGQVAGLGMLKSKDAGGAGVRTAEFTTVRELGQVLGASVQCQQCIVRQVFRYALGRKETPFDRPTIDRAFEDFRKSGFKFKRLLVALATWSEFAVNQEI